MIRPENLNKLEKSNLLDNWMTWITFLLIVKIYAKRGVKQGIKGMKWMLGVFKPLFKPLKEKVIQVIQVIQDWIKLNKKILSKGALIAQILSILFLGKVVCNGFVMGL